jgi:hypothetical protein
VAPDRLLERPGRPDSAIAWARDASAAMRPFMTGDVYLNFEEDQGEQHVRAGYSPENHARLVALKDRYDLKTSSGSTKTSPHRRRRLAGTRGQTLPGSASRRRTRARPRFIVSGRPVRSHRALSRKGITGLIA